MDRRASSRFRTLFYPQPPSFSQKQRDFPQIAHFCILHNSQTSGTLRAAPYHPPLSILQLMQLPYPPKVAHFGNFAYSYAQKRRKRNL